MHSKPTRAPVVSRGQRVKGLYSRTRADGTVTFEYVGRLDGKVRTIKLDAATKTEAVEEVESLRSGVRERRTVVAARRRTLVRDVRDEYLAFIESLNGTRAEKSPATVEDITAKLDKYVLPAIGHLRISDVDERDIRELALSAHHRSRSTVYAILSVCSGLFTWALREKLATFNPVRAGREVYAHELLPDTPTKQLRALTDDEFSRAMEHVSDTFAPIVSVTYETGLRIGEVLGLTWGKLDLERGTVEVSAQLDRKGKTIRPTKTKRVRTIPLSVKATSVLRKHRARMKREGFAVNEIALVFVTSRGLPQSRRNALRAWQTALEKIGVTDAGLHSLRHTFVSRLAEDNVAAVLTSELVGHSRVSTTTDYYSRVRGGEAERIERLRDALRRPKKQRRSNVRPQSG